MTLKSRGSVDRTSQTLSSLIQNIHQPKIIRISLKNLFKARRLYSLSKGKLQSRDYVTNALRCNEPFI